MDDTFKHVDIVLERLLGTSRSLTQPPTTLPTSESLMLHSLVMNMCNRPAAIMHNHGKL
jgi:hypothetical protein